MYVFKLHQSPVEGRFPHLEECLVLESWGRALGNGPLLRTLGNGPLPRLFALTLIAVIAACFSWGWAMVSGKEVRISPRSSSSSNLWGSQVNASNPGFIHTLCSLRSLNSVTLLSLLCVCVFKSAGSHASKRGPKSLSDVLKFVCVRARVCVRFSFVSVLSG